MVRIMITLPYRGFAVNGFFRSFGPPLDADLLALDQSYNRFHLRSTESTLPLRKHHDGVGAWQERPVSADEFDQLHGLDVQRVRQLHNRKEADIALAAFEVPHVIPMQVGHFRKFFLRQVALFAQFSKSSSKGR